MKPPTGKKQISIIPGLIIIALIIIPGIAGAIKNPSMVYCTGLGYEYDVDKTPGGDEIGMCHLSQNITVTAWIFLQGLEGQEFSYCRQKGYDQKFVQNATVCENAMVDSCMVCILPDHREVEATLLMNLSYEENTCGDGICGYPNNYENCPADCPSGTRDGYCDKVNDSICDRDCTRGEDPDCPLLVLNTTGTRSSASPSPTPQSSPTTTTTPGLAATAGIAGTAAAAFIVAQRAKR